MDHGGTDDSSGDEGGTSPTRARRRIEAARDRANAVTDRVMAARPDTPLIDAGFELYERDSRIAGWMLAGSIAFRLFMLLVPLLLVLVAGVGFMHVSQADASTGKSLGLSGTLVTMMSTVGKNAARGRWITLLVGLSAATMAMRSLIKSLRIVHNLAWGTFRKASVNRLIDLLVGMGLLVVTSAYVIGAQWLRSHAPGGGILVSFVIGAGAGLLWFVVQEVLPRAEGAPWTALVPGAVLVAVLTQALHAVTVFYLAGRVTRMSETYGPLGVAIVTLLWLYLLGRIMVGAAVLNAGIWDRRSRGVRSWAPIDFSILRQR